MFESFSEREMREHRRICNDSVQGKNVAHMQTMLAENRKKQNRMVTANVEDKNKI